MSKKRDFEGNRLHHFELSDTNRTVRWVLIILLLVVAAVSLTVGLMGALKTPAGWQTVEGNTTGLHCGEEFVLNCDAPCKISVDFMDFEEDEKLISSWGVGGVNRISFKAEAGQKLTVNFKLRRK